MSNYVLGICIHLDQLDARLSNAIIHTSGNIGVASFKVHMANSNTAIIKTPVFEWYVVRCGSQNGHQTDKCFEIGLRTQNSNHSRLNGQHDWGPIYHLMSTRIIICGNAQDIHIHLSSHTCKWLRAQFGITDHLATIVCFISYKKWVQIVMFSRLPCIPEDM